MRLFPVLALGLALAGCAFELEPIGGPVSLAADLASLVRELRERNASERALSMRDPKLDYGAWGQLKPYRIAVYDSPLPVIKYTARNEPPQVQNITLSMASAQAGGLVPPQVRWQVIVGVGNASATWLLDAQKLQQISVSGQSVQVNVIATPSRAIGSAFGDGTPTFERPALNDQIVAAAFATNGNTSTQRATLSYSVLVSAGDEIRLPVPAGANTFKVLNQGSTGAFAATTRYIAVTSGPAVSWLGTEVAPQFLNEDFLVMQPNTQILRVAGLAGSGVVDPVEALLMFGLDL